MSDGIKVQLKPDLQAKLDEWTAQTGRGADELVEDALTGYFDELSELRSVIDSRYDDLEAGRVQPMTAAELSARQREKRVKLGAPSTTTECPTMSSIPTLPGTLSTSGNNVDAADRVVAGLLASS